MKDALGGKFMTVFVAPTPKTYSYLIEDGNSDNKAKRTNKCEVKIILKSQQRFKCITHNIYTEEINKISLRSNDDKRL